MTAATDAARRPSDTWEFGAYRYGLEPLYLPPATDAAQLGRPLFRDGSVQGPAREHRPGPGTGAAADLETADDLFWFRWITGHQLTFLLWHLMARVLGPARVNGEHNEEAINTLVLLTEGYNAMLMYTSSCTPQAYERFIRPSMYRQHHGFSGVWAPDYAPVRRLFHGRPPEWIRGPEAKTLYEAVQLNHTVHAAVAARLVPGSESLLQQHASVMRLQERTVCGDIYDAYFLTLRTRVDREEISRQLGRRIRALLADTGCNGFYPSGAKTILAQTPDRLRTPAILDYERRFPDILARLNPLSESSP